MICEHLVVRSLKKLANSKRSLKMPQQVRLVKYDTNLTYLPICYHCLKLIVWATSQPWKAPQEKRLLQNWLAICMLQVTANERHGARMRSGTMKGWMIMVELFIVQRLIDETWLLNDEPEKLFIYSNQIISIHLCEPDQWYMFTPRNKH